MSRTERLRADMKGKHRANKVLVGVERDRFDAQKAHREMLTPLEQVRQPLQIH
jgi:hypothetical protein